MVRGKDMIRDIMRINSEGVLKLRSSKIFDKWKIYYKKSLKQLIIKEY